MGRGKFKAKPTGQRQFSTPEEMLAGTSSRPRSFKRQEAEYKEEEESEESEQESGEESDEETAQKHKGTQGVIEINNPNLVKPKNMKARDLDAGKTTELSRREREELEKQRAHERYMRLQEQGKTEQARKDLERLSLVRQQREEAARKREEEKAGFNFIVNVATRGLGKGRGTGRRRTYRATTNTLFSLLSCLERLKPPSRISGGFLWSR
ncbi:hypothetical protein DITRI_Ditri19aG0043700 [Diplodiscus trichospermus]